MEEREVVVDVEALKSLMKVSRAVVSHAGQTPAAAGGKHSGARALWAATARSGAERRSRSEQWVRRCDGGASERYLRRQLGGGASVRGMCTRAADCDQCLCMRLPAAYCNLHLGLVCTCCCARYQHAPLYPPLTPS